jgi:hypothetical protein
MILGLAFLGGMAAVFLCRGDWPLKLSGRHAQTTDNSMGILVPMEAALHLRGGEYIWRLFFPHFVFPAINYFDPLCWTGAG